MSHHALIQDAEVEFGRADEWAHVLDDAAYFDDDVPEYEGFCVTCGDSAPLGEGGSDVSDGYCTCLQCHAADSDDAQACAVERLRLLAGVVGA